MDALLKSNIAHYVGMCDRSGHPIITMLVSGQRSLMTSHVDDVVGLFRRFVDVAPVQQKLNGFSVLADLSGSTTVVAEKIITVLTLLQSENRKAVSCLFLIKPISWKRRRSLAKLTGYRDAKKGRPPKTPFHVVAVKDAKTLLQHIDRSALPDEFGGALHINRDVWVQFYTLLESTSSVCQQSLAAAESAKRQAQEACELRIPSSAADIAELISKVDNIHDSMFEQAKLDAAIEACNNTLAKLQLPEDGTATAGSPRRGAPSPFIQLFHADLLREAARRIRLQQTALVELSERLQMICRQAKARLVQASQLLEHRRKARKMCKWISTVAVPQLKQLANIPDTIDELRAASQFLDYQFKEYVKVDVVQPAEHIFTDVEYMAMQESAELQQSQSFVGQLRESVQHLQECMASAEHTLAVGPALLEAMDQLSAWTAAVIEALPGPTSHSNGSQLAGRDLVWQDSCRATVMAKGSSAPSRTLVDTVKSNAGHLRSESKRNQASCLLLRASILFDVLHGFSRLLNPEDVASWQAELQRESSFLHLQLSNECDRHMPVVVALDPPSKVSVLEVSSAGLEMSRASVSHDESGSSRPEEHTTHLLSVDQLHDQNEFNHSAAEQDVVWLSPCSSPFSCSSEPEGPVLQDDNSTQSEDLRRSDRLLQTHYVSVAEGFLEATTGNGALALVDSDVVGEHTSSACIRPAGESSGAAERLHADDYALDNVVMASSETDQKNPGNVQELATESNCGESLLSQRAPQTLNSNLRAPKLAANFISMRNPNASIVGSASVDLPATVQQPHVSASDAKGSGDPGKGGASSVTEARANQQITLVSDNAEPLRLQQWWQSRPIVRVLNEIEHDQHLTAAQKLAQMAELIENVDVSSGKEPLWGLAHSLNAFAGRNQWVDTLSRCSTLRAGSPLLQGICGSTGLVLPSRAGADSSNVARNGVTDHNNSYEHGIGNWQDGVLESYTYRHPESRNGLSARDQEAAAVIQSIFNAEQVLQDAA